jgi:cytochrome c-type biogenesis protein CcmF
MTGELGQLALCFALGLSLVMAFAGLAGARNDAAQAAIAARGIANGAAMGMLVFVGLAFFTLMAAFVRSDFSVITVANNSHTAKPLLYKISGVWGNHEGSMLLWVLVLALYAGGVAMAQRGGARLTSAALGFQGLLAASFLLFILAPVSIRCCRILASPSIRPCSMRAMSDCRRPSPMRRRRCWWARKAGCAPRGPSC